MDSRARPAVKSAYPPPAERPVAASGVDAQPITFNAVVAGHGPYVWRVLRRLGVRAADIEDVWQETFIVGLTLDRTVASMTEPMRLPPKSTRAP